VRLSRESLLLSSFDPFRFTQKLLSIEETDVYRAPENVALHRVLDLLAGGSLWQVELLIENQRSSIFHALFGKIISEARISAASLRGSSSIYTPRPR
jgi:hypothetical protein